MSKLVRISAGRFANIVFQGTDSIAEIHVVLSMFQNFLLVNLVLFRFWIDAWKKAHCSFVGPCYLVDATGGGGPAGGGGGGGGGGGAGGGGGGGWGGAAGGGGEGPPPAGP